LLEDSVVVVEWGRGLAEALTDAYLDIELQRPGAVTAELITDFSDDVVEEPRTVVMTGHGPRWEGSSIACAAPISAWIPLPPHRQPLPVTTPWSLTAPPLPIATTPKFSRGSSPM